MADERTIFRGHPSVVTVFGTVTLSILLIAGITVGLVLIWNKLPPPPVRFAGVGLLLIPLIMLLVKWVRLKMLLYEITTERIRTTRGLLSRRTDELELYRVKDSVLVEPLLNRMFGAGNIVVATNDTSNPELSLNGIKGAKEVREQLRASVEECRVRKGARVMEME